MISPKLHGIYDDSLDSEFDFVIGKGEETYEPAGLKNCDELHTDLRQLGTRYQVNYKTNRNYITFDH